MFEHTIGKQSNKVKNTVERGAVKNFAEAIGDPHPIFIDEETGRQSPYKANIAPPTFPRVFDYGSIDELNLPSKGLIHGEQIYHYERPLLVGEVILCYTEVKDYYERSGKSGDMGFLKVKRYGTDFDGGLIFSEEQTVIITEAVRKEMKV
ncbi:MaoC family dehydratase N-terminal domain-containing protein [Halobacillus mangrovi]|uniref:Dehydratase n=1 Tax=Halobacillus mangrovi TaxID=402384 RepID=A0A1W5ZT50_9BACI|nr:MaoC family dehydratase N-terminal domain-containing protein [Halobacillus mangrovi]ARI76468.1 dehydratase [Halobacillus mangrovi]